MHFLIYICVCVLQCLPFSQCMNSAHAAKYTRWMCQCWNWSIRNSSLASLLESEINNNLTILFVVVTTAIAWDSWYCNQTHLQTYCTYIYNEHMQWTCAHSSLVDFWFCNEYMLLWCTNVYNLSSHKFAFWRAHTFFGCFTSCWLVE